MSAGCALCEEKDRGDVSYLAGSYHDRTARGKLAAHATITQRAIRDSFDDRMRVRDDRELKTQDR